MTSNKKITILCIATLTLLTTTGCHRKIGGNQVNSASIGGPSTSYQGVVINVRTVDVHEADHLQDNTTGIGTGAVAGGLLGSAFGKGNGTLVGMGAGALVGGVAGMFVQDALGTQKAYEYTVKLGSGELVTIVQTDETPMAVGRRVFVTTGGTGPNSRSTITPDDSGLPMSTQPMKPLGSEKGPLVVINTNR